MGKVSNVEYVLSQDEVKYALAYLKKKKISCSVVESSNNVQLELNQFIADGMEQSDKESLRRAIRQFRRRRNVKSKEEITGLSIDLPLSKSTVSKIMTELGLKHMNKTAIKNYINEVLKNDLK